MTLTTAQKHRAAGVLLGQATGDALGVPYEFGHVPTLGTARMRGGGLGNYAPGEWSDDTQMAICIARVAATGADLTSSQALDEVADLFLQWRASGPGDIGSQTSSVLYAAERATGSPAVRVRQASQALHARTGRTAGNGALMRTAIVGLTRLDDRVATAAAARAVAELTHADPLAGDSCVLWSEAIRVAVIDGRLDVLAGLDLLPAERRGQWSTWLTAAIEDPTPSRFQSNGYTVAALQAALAALLAADVASGDADSFARALHLAISAGHDTDTVAAITGGLAGGLLGASAVPFQWRRLVHGWPGPRAEPIRARDLITLALNTAAGGGIPGSWPDVARLGYEGQASARVELAVPHPHDPGVLLGTVADLDRLAGLGVDAVVSLCRLGTDQVPAPGIAATDHLEVWLVDSDEVVDNPHLDFVLADTADAVAALRAEGKRVLLHCVAAEQRTPSVALAYAVRHVGREPSSAAYELLGTVPEARGCGLLWDSAAGVGAQ